MIERFGIRMFAAKSWPLLAAVFCIGAGPSETKAVVTATAALASVAYPFSVENGHLLGPGATFLEQQGQKSQFIVLGEPHNSAQVPEFTTALFLALSRTAGYQYLALETDPLFAQEASTSPLRGSVGAMTDWVQRYPAAVTFGTDQEIGMIATAAAQSTAVQPIWGLDQIFGITHVLDRLDALAPSAASRQAVDSVANEIRPHELQRDVAHNYLAEGALPSSFGNLLASYAPMPETEADFLVRQLLLSRTIYEDNVAAESGALTGYEANAIREENMKQLFLRDYRQAERGTSGRPKALVKLGHWHVMQGFNPGNIMTLGDFVCDVARSEGSSAYTVGIFLNGVEGEYGGNLASDPGYAPFVDAAGKDQWVLFDLRALRPYYWGGRISPIPPAVRQAMWQYDAVVLIPHPRHGTCNILRPKLLPAGRGTC